MSALKQAAKLSRAFHGRRNRKVSERTEKLAIRENLAELGRLDYLIVHTPDGYEVKIVFKRAHPRLASSPDGRQLYIVDGDQTVPLDKFGHVGEGRDLLDLGECAEIQYETDKPHLDAPGQTLFYHQFGEETGVRPRLIYDAFARRLSLAGGEYTVEDRGIVN